MKFEYTFFIQGEHNQINDTLKASLEPSFNQFTEVTQRGLKYIIHINEG